jgi:hypothetical protein
VITIYKYRLPFTGPGVVYMPQGARILSAHEQRNEVCVWAAVDTSRPIVQHKLAVLGTGDDSAYVWSVGRFIDTVLLDGGVFVFHVFCLEPANGPVRGLRLAMPDSWTDHTPDRGPA